MLYNRNMGKRGNRPRNRNNQHGQGGSGQNTQKNSSGQGSGGQNRRRRSSNKRTTDPAVQQEVLFGATRKPSGGQKKRRRIPFDPEKHRMPEPIPQREYEPCPISGEEIDHIASAIAHPGTGKPARFESVIKRLEQQIIAEQEGEEIEEGRIAYLGRGTFGLITFENVPGKNQPMLVVQKYIEYEDNDRHEWRRELAPGISRDYIPNPQPLSQLYTPEEIKQFPRFEAPTAGQVGRSEF